MLLLIVALLADTAGARPATPNLSFSLPPMYYADRLGETIQPVTAPIDLSGSDSMAVLTVNGALRIGYRSICSLSYSSAAVSASGREGFVYRRLLTIGFLTETGVHHNLVVQLRPRGAAAILKAITARTGLKLGDPPKN